RRRWFSKGSELLRDKYDTSCRWCRRTRHQEHSKVVCCFCRPYRARCTKSKSGAQSLCEKTSQTLERRLDQTPNYSKALAAASASTTSITAPQYVGWRRGGRSRTVVYDRHASDPH